MGKIGGFTFFSSYHESLKDLESEDRRELLEAIVDFVFDDIEPELSGFKRTIWTLMLPNLTTSKNKSKNAQKEPTKNQKKIKSKSKAKQKKKKKKREIILVIQQEVYTSLLKKTSEDLYLQLNLKKLNRGWKTTIRK